MRNLVFGASALLLSAAFIPIAVAAPVTVNGGAIKSVQTTTNGDQLVGTLAFALVPGAIKTINVPAGGDTAIVTFSAECILTGNTGEGDWVEVEIRDNNVAIAPTGNATPLAFCNNDSYKSASVQAVKRLTPGAHQIKVIWKIRKSSVGSLTGVLDDYTLTIAVAE